MRVLVDATPVSPRLKGTGRFIVGLLAHLPEAAPNDEFLAVTWPAGQDLLKGIPGIKLGVAISRSGLRWESRDLGNVASRAKADAVLTFRELVGFTGPPTLLHLAEPPGLRLRVRGRSFKPWAKDVVMAALLRGSISRASVVTASSDATATWVEHRTGWAPQVIPPGIDSMFLNPCSEEWSGPPYLLHPATGDQREGTELTIAAYAASAARRDGVRLVIVGVGDGAGRKVRALVAAASLAEDVDVLGWLTDDELRCRYAHAIALVHPSLFEGFAGLQPLEAMAQGAPVIALEGHGVTEVLQGAARLVSLPDPTLLREAIDELAADDGLRSLLSERGKMLASNFTWSASASRFAGVLHGIQESRGC